MHFQKLIVFILSLSLFSSCAFTRIKRTKDIVFTAPNPANGTAVQKLNVYAPRSKKELKPVMVFFYGGNWTSGRKGLYSFFGSRWARKGVVTVIPDYPKSPEAENGEMTMTAATAIKWVKENIEQYGGNPDQIFVSGHSAGGQLAALSVIDNSYFQKLQTVNPVKGIILLDPAGLDMYRYMREVDYGPDSSYLQIFGKDTTSWKKVSAIFQLHNNMPPMLIYTGERTYYTISIGAQRFVNKTKNYGTDVTYKIVKRKKHIPMITQFFNTANPRYKEIKAFMTKQP